MNAEQIYKNWSEYPFQNEFHCRQFFSTFLCVFYSSLRFCAGAITIDIKWNSSFLHMFVFYTKRFHIDAISIVDQTSAQQSTVLPCAHVSWWHQLEIVRLLHSLFVIFFVFDFVGVSVAQTKTKYKLQCMHAFTKSESILCNERRRFAPWTLHYNELNRVANNICVIIDLCVPYAR